MTFPSPTTGRISWAARLLLLLAFAAPAALAARVPVPAIRIPLNPIGYQPILPEFLAAGSSMATLNYVDATHLLVTFPLRRLMKRDSSDPPGDADRTVGAFLLELPSGKEIARAEWRLHDRGQYLWDLGSGRFLLRIREQLSLLEPGVAGRAEPLRQVPLLHSDRRIVSISVSAEHDLLTVQTVEHPQGLVLADAPTTPARSPVLVSFYRLLHSAGKLTVASAGMVRSAAPLALPVHTGGFLDTIDSGHSSFSFHFNTGRGAPADVGKWDSTCFPRSTFVSRSEFVSFGCRGGSDHQTIAGFNLGGDFMWQQSFYEPHVNPNFAFAPAAGRFALGRIVVTPGTEASGELTPAQITTQEVRVYQTYNGRVVLRISCTPPMRAGQNFALSADGLQLAVLRETAVQHRVKNNNQESSTTHEAAVEIYDLPALSRQDQTAVSEARKLVPPDTGLQINATFTPLVLPSIPNAPAADAPSKDRTASGSPTKPEASPPLSTVEPPAIETLAADPSAPAHPAPAVPHMTEEGDAQVGSPTQRTPPTLYAPDEKRPTPKPGQQSH